MSAVLSATFQVFDNQKHFESDMLHKTKQL